MEFVVLKGVKDVADIALCRIDSRLIHGQVMTKWVNQSQANRIIVVSDDLANDDFMRSIYLMSAPEGIKVDCFTKRQTIDSFADGCFGAGRVLLLLPDLASMKELVDGGVNVTSIQVGGLGGAPNRKVVFQNITLDDADAAVLDDLSSRGIEIYFQTIPEDAPQGVEFILKKYRS